MLPLHWILCSLHSKTCLWAGHALRTLKGWSPHQHLLKVCSNSHHPCLKCWFISYMILSVSGFPSCFVFLLKFENTCSHTLCIPQNFLVAFQVLPKSLQTWISRSCRTLTPSHQCSNFTPPHFSPRGWMWEWHWPFLLQCFPWRCYWGAWLLCYSNWSHSPPSLNLNKTNWPTLKM